VLILTHLALMMAKDVGGFDRSWKYSRSPQRWRIRQALVRGLKRYDDDDRRRCPRVDFGGRDRGGGWCSPPSAESGDRRRGNRVLSNGRSAINRRR
jgi:hypothetical protein